MRLTRDRILFVTGILLSAWLVNRKPSLEESRSQMMPAFQQPAKYMITPTDSVEGGFSNTVSYHVDQQAPRPLRALYWFWEKFLPLAVRKTCWLSFATMKCDKVIMIFIFLFLVSAAPAISQCSVCTKTAQQLGEGPAKGLNSGILYLAFAPFAIVGYIGYRWWKSNREP